MDKRIAEIKAREQAATEGPWFSEGNEVHSQYPDPGGDGDDYTAIVITLDSGIATEELFHNATFIAHARSDVPCLLGEVERLEGEVQGLKGEMAGVEMGASLGVGMIEDQLAAEREKYQKLVEMVDGAIGRTTGDTENYKYVCACAFMGLKADYAALQEENDE